MGVAGETRLFRVRHRRRTRRRAPSRARRGPIPGARDSRATVTSSTAPGPGDIFIEQLPVTFSLDSDTAPGPGLTVPRAVARIRLCDPTSPPPAGKPAALVADAQWPGWATRTAPSAGSPAG